VEFDAVMPVVVMPVPVAVIFPAVIDPMFAVGPEEEPVREPVTFPVTFPVMPPVTTRFVVVAVPETTRAVVDAEVVATRDPRVKDPVLKESAFPVLFKLPETVRGDSKSTPAVARPTAPAALVRRSPEASPVMERLVVEAPRETRRSEVLARVRTARMELVLFPLMTRSFPKVYVPTPAKVPGVVVMTPVPLLYEMTPAPESEEEEILLLNAVQSVVERQPKVAPDAVLQVRAPFVDVRPAPILLRRVPFREMSEVESPFVVAVAETKRTEVEAVPVVVEFWNTPPVALTFVAFTFVA
jgi:hypothetical protein